MATALCGVVKSVAPLPRVGVFEPLSIGGQSPLPLTGPPKKAKSRCAAVTGTDSLLLAWWLFLELATLNWSPEIY